MSSHIKHMDKIDAQHLSNFKHPNVSTFCWYNFYCAKFYFKKFKISLSRMELPNAFSIDFLFIFFNSKTLIPLEIIATAVAQKKKEGVRQPLQLSPGYATATWGHYTGQTDLKINLGRVV